MAGDGNGGRVSARQAAAPHEDSVATVRANPRKKCDRRQGGSGGVWHRNTQEGRRCRRFRCMHMQNNVGVSVKNERRVRLHPSCAVVRVDHTCTRWLRDAIDVMNDTHGVYRTCAQHVTGGIPASTTL